jgi:succinate dehydrogenase / fumarate reductase cytochrome b subunit
VWDAGYGLDAPLRDQMAWATLIGGFALTIFVWGIGFAVR